MNEPKKKEKYWRRPFITSTTVNTIVEKRQDELGASSKGYSMTIRQIVIEWAAMKAQVENVR
jgi:hypothetical protein